MVFGVPPTFGVGKTTSIIVALHAEKAGPIVRRHNGGCGIGCLDRHVVGANTGAASPNIAASIPPQSYNFCCFGATMRKIGAAGE